MESVQDEWVTNGLSSDPIRKLDRLFNPPILSDCQRSALKRVSMIIGKEVIDRLLDRSAERDPVGQLTSASLSEFITLVFVFLFVFLVTLCYSVWYESVVVLHCTDILDFNSWGDCWYLFNQVDCCHVIYLYLPLLSLDMHLNLSFYGCKFVWSCLCWRVFLGPPALFYRDKFIITILFSFFLFYYYFFLHFYY